MKWYLASRTKHTEKLLQIAKLLKSNNQEISSNWIYIDENIQPFTDNINRVQEIAEDNVLGLLVADIFLKFNDDGGKDIFSEFGVCLGRLIKGESVKIYIIGDYKKATLTQLHPKVIHLKTLQEVFDLEKINYTDFEFPAFNN